MRPRYAVPVLALLAVPSLAAAADPPAHRNAAMQYWLAFELLPRVAQLEGDDKRLYEEWDTIPLTKERVEGFKNWQGCLKYLHRGAALKECAWPSTVNRARDGIGTYTPHHQKADHLARIVLIRARIRFEQGRVEDAFEDVLAAVKLARDVGRDEGLLAVMCEHRIERDAIRCVARNLWAADGPALLAFRKRWNALTPTSVADALRAERDMYVAGLMTRGLDFGSDPEREDEPEGRLATLKLLVGLQTEAEAVLEFVQATAREFDRAIAVAGLPFDQLGKAEASWLADLNANAAGDDEIVHRFVCLLVPDAAKMRVAHGRMDALRGMLRDAIAARLAGKDLLRPGPDPFTGKPFVLTKTADGYELRTNLTPHLQEPAVLSVRTVAPRRP